MINIPLSLGFIYSLLMLFGVLGIGCILCAILKRFISYKVIGILSGCEFLVAIILLSLSISWITIIYKHRVVYELFGYFLIINGILCIIVLITTFRVKNININKCLAIPRIDLFLIISLPILYILSNCAEITNADSIDYHIGYAINFLRERFDPHPEWYNGRMASIGEKINAIGVSIGAKQFGPLLQCVGYISIGVILIKTIGRRFRQNYILLLAFCSSPVFLFLCISAKPQILPSALSCFSFFIIKKIVFDTESTLNDKRIFILLSLILSSVAFTHKFNFLISYFFMCIIILWLNKKSASDIAYTLLSIIIVSILVITPAYLDKQIRYESTIVEYFISPVSSMQDSLNFFVFSVRKFKESLFYFPFYLLIPSSFGNISTILGIGILFCIIPLFTKNKISKFYLFIISVYIFLLYLISMPSSRFFLEPYIWLLLILGKYSFGVNKFSIKCLIIIVRIQSILVIISLLPISMYSVAESFAIYETNYKHKYIYGYNIQQWYTKKLPPDASILLDHRSVSLADRDAITFEVHEYGKNDLKEHLLLLDQLERYKVEYVITVDRSSNFNDIKNCSEILLFGPEEFIFATRNPFNSGIEHGYIFKIIPKKFINCLMFQ